MTVVQPGVSRTVRAARADRVPWWRGIAVALTGTMVMTAAVSVTGGTPANAADATGADQPAAAAITTRVFDRATGEPVKGVCVLALPVHTFRLPNACSTRSGGGGRVTVEVPEPGQYNLFALPKPDSPYGAQWVGPDGGTGRQQDARRVTLAAGETKRVNQILLDPRATISGVLDMRNNDNDGLVSIAAPDLDLHQDMWSATVGADGRFDIDWVGPYEWPVLFRLRSEPAHWSGQIGNRLQAETVLAVIGGPAEPYQFWPTSRTRGSVRVILRDEEPGLPGRVIFYNAVTRDVMGFDDFSRRYGVAQESITGGQQIKIECQCPEGTRWYGGTDFDSATPVAVTYFGTVSVDLR